MAQPQTPPARRKSITERLSPYAKAANLAYKVMRATGQIEFFVVTKDRLGNPQHATSHRVQLTPDELAHLSNGGKLVVAHACGYEAHVRL